MAIIPIVVANSTQAYGTLYSAVVAYYWSTYPHIVSVIGCVPPGSVGLEPPDTLLESKPSHQHPELPSTLEC